MAAKHDTPAPPPPPGGGGPPDKPAKFKVGDMVMCPIPPHIPKEAVKPEWAEQGAVPCRVENQGKGQDKDTYSVVSEDAKHSFDVNEADMTFVSHSPGSTEALMEEKRKAEEAAAAEKKDEEARAKKLAAKKGATTTTKHK